MTPFEFCQRDPRVIDFAWRLPLSMKQGGNKGEWVLRQVLYKHVPEHLIDRPKMGSGVPIGTWLRTERATGPKPS